MKILIAEDDTTSRLLFGATLRKLGHSVVAVEDGHEAWKAWQQGEYPLLISDWMMPHIDGLQLCRMIRGEPGLQYTYVILLTSLDSKGSYLEGMDAGADDFITKPFDEEQLAARLRVAERILGLHNRLHIQATHDHLTGVWNRGAIMAYLQKELERGAAPRYLHKRYRSGPRSLQASQRYLRASGRRRGIARGSPAHGTCVAWL